MTELTLPHCIDFTDPPSMEAWAEALIDLENLKKGFVYVAWFLSVKPSFFVGGYTTKDQDLALRLKTAPNSIKNAILTLGTLGFLSWSWVKKGSIRERHLLPTLPRQNRKAVGPAAASEDGLNSAVDVTPATPDEKPLGCDNQRHGNISVLPIFELLAGPALSEPIPAMDPIQGSDSTQSGCDETARLQQRNQGLTALPALRKAETTGPSVSPPRSEDTQIGCHADEVWDATNPRKPPRRYNPQTPLWLQSPNIQLLRAEFHAKRLAWNAVCTHDACGSRGLSFVCAEDGHGFCSRHARHAAHPIALSLFELDRR